VGFAVSGLDRSNVADAQPKGSGYAPGPILRPTADGCCDGGLGNAEPEEPETELVEGGFGRREDVVQLCRYFRSR